MSTMSRPYVNLRLCVHYTHYTHYTGFAKLNTGANILDS